MRSNRQIKLKHQFCKFHIKQAIKKDYFDKNQLSDEEKDILTNLKQDIYRILDAKDLDSAKTFRNESINKRYPKNKFTNKIIGNSPFPTLKN